MLSVVVTLPSAAQGQIEGLLGDMDGDANNDFRLPNGTVLSSDLSDSEIYYDFGLACK